MNHLELLQKQIERRIGTLSAEERAFMSHNWMTYDGAADLAQAISEQRIEASTPITIIRSDKTQLELYSNAQRVMRLA